jgi:hypothetical protein
VACHCTFLCSGKPLHRST